jgi:hypothetical protein
MPSPFQSLVRAARAFFVDDIRLRREGSRVVLRLESASDTHARGPAAGPDTANRKTTPEQRRAEEQLAGMRSELKALLNEDPQARRNMPHLAYVEQQLAIQGLALLDKLPVPLLRQGLKQFEGAVTNWSPVGLATLRSKMAVAVQQRGLGNAEGPEEVDTPLPEDADTLRAALEVSEVPLADSEAALVEAYRAMRLGPDGGSGEIRTHGGVEPSPVFKTGALNRSATLP